MKRLSALFIVAALVVTVATTMMMPSNAKAVGGQLFGQPQDIIFTSHYGSEIDYVVVKVAKSWLGSKRVSLEVTIRSANGEPHDHGTRVVSMTDEDVEATPFPDYEGDKGYDFIRFDWPVSGADVSATEYDVRVQVLFNGKPHGDPMGGSFFPY